jgi:putative membrane protein insertion efficiency factor
VTDAALVGAPVDPGPSFVARVLILPIRAWRLVSVHLPPRCRFHPSCSQYAIEAITLHGAGRGSWLAIRRVGRCHPWHAGGLDPVPTPNVRSQITAPAGAAEEG